ncbi:mucin-3B-like [Ruditapes philippinarum]|uniref:mucin-3B-like n=1 Tax=Ruditapes philippinarum TaxID=129788 RepID=UPI00295A6A73|nr:mucin-3B-like [Ruditapes philippinarum]
MSDVFKSFVLFIALTFFKVSGVDFTISRERVLLGSTGTLTMTCDVSETDVNNIYLISIRKLRSATLSGSEQNDWQTLIIMEAGINETPSLSSDIAAVAATKDYVAGGLWDSTTPANTFLTLDMNIEKLVCDDARTYRCELSYKSSTTSSVTSANRNSTFSAYVRPQVTSLITRKNGFIVQGTSPSDIAIAEVGDELELTCTANIGSLPGTIIRWHRTSETSQNDDFIGYQAPQGTYDEGTAVSDNQCGYTREATTRYNTTAADANRENNLAFECYVTVTGDPYGNSYTSENNPRFYTDVNKPSYEETGSITGRNEISVAAGVMAAIVIASLIVGILIGVVFTWVVLNRKRTATGLKKQNQHQPTSVSRETELFNVPSHSPNTYEQLQNRTETESRMAYDSLNAASANSSTVPDSQSQYESLKHGGGGTSHTYAGLNINQ